MGWLNVRAMKMISSGVKLNLYFDFIGFVFACVVGWWMDWPGRAGWPAAYACGAPCRLDSAPVPYPAPALSGTMLALTGRAPLRRRWRPTPRWRGLSTCRGVGWLCWKKKCYVSVEWIVGYEFKDVTKLFLDIDRRQSLRSRLIRESYFYAFHIAI